MELAVDGGPASSTPRPREGSTEVDLTTLRQLPLVGPSAGPGTIQRFGGPHRLEAPSASPAPSDCRARPGND